MEKKKNVFGDIKSMLTRDQMKQVKGGSAGDQACGTQCTGYDHNFFTFPGTCGTIYPGVCGCFGYGGEISTSNNCQWKG